MVSLSPIFVADTKVIIGYNFVAPLINIPILVLLFNLHTESKVLTFVNTNRRPDQQKSIQWKFHIIKIYFTWMKKTYMIKIFLWNTNLFWLNENLFWCHKKRWYNENIFYWIQICFDSMKIYFDLIWIFIFSTFQQP